jgi:hypothetical protein
MRRGRSAKARAWSLLGWVLVLASSVIFGAGRLIAPHGSLAIALAYFLGITGCTAGARCLLRAKQLRALDAHDALAHDPRPPVVYFRPFSADSEASRRIVSTSWVTAEEQLATAVNHLGPFVAFGVPRESLPAIGAARLYEDDARWQGAARELMARAALVLLRIGSGPSFWWEFTTAVRSAAPQKVVLLIPHDEALYWEFRAASVDCLPRALPALRAWHRKKWFHGGLKALIFFDAAWSPSVVDLNGVHVPWKRFSPNMPLVPILQMALRPICDNAGLPWIPPKVNRRLFALIAAMVVWIASIVVQIVLAD